MSLLSSNSSSLTRKLLVVYIPLVCFTVLLLFSVIELRSYYQQVNELKRSLKELTQVQSAAFTKAVWELNDRQLEALLAELQRTPHFRGAIVQDPGGIVIASAGETDGGDLELRSEAPLIYKTEHLSEDLGLLSVSFHRDRIYGSLLQRLAASGVVLLVLTLTLISVTVLATRRLVIRPIRQLHERVIRIAEGVDNVTIEDVRSGDEIGELTSAFAAMQRKVVDRESQLERARESTLTELLESAPDAMIVVDTTGTICRINSATEVLFGYGANELRGQRVEALLPDRFRRGHGAHFIKYFENPRARSMGAGLELFGVRKDGSEFPVEIGLSPFHEPEGPMAVAAIRDITKRKEREAELARKEQRFRTLVANLPGTVYRCLHDKNRTAQFVSDEVEVLTGYPQGDFIENAARTIDSVIHKDDRIRVSDTVQAAVAKHEPWIIEYRVVHADGHVRWAGERGRAIFREDGKVDYLDGVIADISQQKELEARLQLASKQAEAASHAKSDFLSSMSHELRTPLNGILGYAQILQRDKAATARQLENVDSIINCGDHLLALINDVLDLSKIEAGQIDLLEEPCNLAKLLKSIGDIVGERARSRSLKFEIEVAPEVPQGIIIDAAKLRQVLVNLLGNAVKFTSEGSVKLVVSESADHRLCFDVIDTGVGMEPGELKQIFDPFKQVEAGKAAGGTGLGLAISQRLVKAMGGDIHVESEKGKGSCFQFLIRFEEVDVGDLSQLTEEVSERADFFLAPGQTARVLVADDRDTNRNILDQMLGEAGFEVVLADDGDTALDMLQASLFDIVLLDIRMPRLNGIEVIRRIRQDENLRMNKVIAVTASVFPEFKDKAIAEGFDDFLPKPFRVSELMEKLQKHLNVEWRSPEGTESNASAGAIAASVANTDAELYLHEEALVKLRAALKIKNMSALKTLANSLAENSDTAAAGAKIAKLTRTFDFAALAKLEQELSHKE